MQPNTLFLSLLFFLFSGLTLHAQDAEIQTITGTVIDKKTGEPIQFAHVGIPERGIGTISGGDGQFTLKVPDYYRNSTFTVSFLGYKTYRQNITAITGPLTVYLEPAALDLMPVVVMDDGAVENIIRKAVDAIPDNYPTKSTRMTGFYRESKTDSEQNYTYLAEGVLDIYKKSYRNDTEGQVALVQGRQVALLPEEEMNAHTHFSSGHLAPHRFDFVKHREDFIDEEKFADYRYWIQGFTTYDDMPVYIIGFDSDENGRGRMRGKVFIDTLNYAFIRAEFEITPYGLRKTSDYPLYVGNWEGNRYVVNYRKVGEKWFLSSALREGEWRDGGLYSNDVLITEVDAGNSRPIPYIERLNRGALFLSLTGDYNEDYWLDFNTTPLARGLEESVSQMNARQKAEEVFDPEYMAELQRQRDSTQAARIEEMKAEGTYSEAMELPNVPELNPFKVQTQFRLGGGVHLLPAGPEPLRLTYLLEDSFEPVLELTDTMPWRPQEYVWQTDLSIYFKKNFFVHWGITRDFWNSIYKENAIGIGTSVNISKGRPVFLRAAADYSWFKYARKIGEASNEFGEFKAEGKKFKADQVNLYYGDLTHSLKASLELAVELHPSLELYARGAYFLPFAYNSHIYLWERGRFFRKKVRVKSDRQFILEQADQPFDRRIADYGTFLITVGVTFK